MVGGNFSEVNSTLRESLARLNSNGSLDTSFVPPTFPNTGIYSLAIQPDGKILIGGTFVVLGSQPQESIARLNTNGSIDDTFLIGVGTSQGDDVEDIVLQPNGKILIGGSINSVNGIARNNLARLNADGTLDTSFNPDVDNEVWDISLAESNPQKILIGGDFNSNGFYWLGHILPVPAFRSQSEGIWNFMGARGFHCTLPPSATTFDYLGMHLDWIWARGLRIGTSAVYPLRFSDHHAVWTQVALPSL